ncbi:hypothetical protein [Shewanella sp. UCD-KL12]|uniref:hypothetical protein n=1 Tax=Shewanella sp. UCD-KL12 TaxID=1917163 RepID=UPI000970B401|nr:hypothetical protein [Shewanella sp. UCD-KL12]
MLSSKTLYVTAFLIAISGCAASKKEVADFDVKVKDKFKTDIRTNGIKLFTYQAKLAAPDDIKTQLPHQERISQVNRSRRANSKRYEVDLSDWTAQIELGLNKTLDMTGYCREGYLELSRIIEVGRGEIRGECNEGATDEDRSKFSS